MNPSRARLYAESFFRPNKPAPRPEPEEDAPGLIESSSTLNGFVFITLIGQAVEVEQRITSLTVEYPKRQTGLDVVHRQDMAEGKLYVKLRHRAIKVVPAEAA